MSGWSRTTTAVGRPVSGAVGLRRYRRPTVVFGRERTEGVEGVLLGVAPGHGNASRNGSSQSGHVRTAPNISAV